MIFLGLNPSTGKVTVAKKGAQTKVFNSKRMRIPMVTVVRICQKFENSEGNHRKHNKSLK